MSLFKIVLLWAAGWTLSSPVLAGTNLPPGPIAAPNCQVWRQGMDTKTETGLHPDSTLAPRTYRLGADIRNAGRVFVSDAARVYSAPARLNRRTALWLGGIIAVGGLVYIYDREIFDAFQRSKNDPLYKPIRKLGERFERFGYMGASNKYLVGGLAFGYLVKWDKAVSICSDVLESHFIAGGVKNVANKAFGRYRPFEGKGPRFFKFDGGTSFPSGHAANIVQMASIFSHHINFAPFTVAAYTVAGAVCLERITSSGHWPSDVYFASIYGYFVSKEILRLNDERRLRIVPVTGIGGDATGLVVVIAL